MESIELDCLFTIHGLKETDLYFLDLIPLVEMIWADGNNQEEEIRILAEFAHRHRVELNSILGFDAITESNLEDFLQRFVHRRPPQELLAELRSFACKRLLQRSSKAQGHDKARKIFEYCLDIAAACVVNYPYALRERIMERERELLIQLLPLLTRESLDEAEPIV